MSLLLPALNGSQVPTLLVEPPEVASSAAVEAIELAASAGLVLDPWQELTLRVGLAERRDGKWAARDVGLFVPRQNGKGAVLEARELFGLFLGGERLIMHSAHEFKTAAEAFLRIMNLIEQTPDLDRMVQAVRRAHGSEAIELKSGQRLRFVARSGGSGRGFSADCIILDEVYNLPKKMMAAMLPTLSARPNPQVWFTSSSPPDADDNSEHIRRLRRRARSDSPGRLAYLEWSAPPTADPDDRDMWAATNPGLGIIHADGGGLTLEDVEGERDGLDVDSFLTERLGVWPLEPDEVEGLIPLEAWDACLEPRAYMRGMVTFSVDVNEDRDWSSVSVAGDWNGRPTVELLADRKGTEWVPQFVLLAHRAAVATEGSKGCIVDAGGPAGSLADEIESLGVPVVRATARQVMYAAGRFFDAIMRPAPADRESDELDLDRPDDRLAHRDQPDLRLAVAVADKRDSGESWLFARRASGGNVGPVISCSLAMWGHETVEAESPKPVFAF